MAQLIDQWYCCKNTYTGYKELVNHLEIDHLDKEIFNYKCKKCSRKLDIINEFIIHFICNHVSHCLFCTDCDQGCISPQEIYTHSFKCKKNEVIVKNSLIKNLGVEENFPVISKNGKGRKPKQSIVEECLVCGGKHALANCSRFLNKNALDRTNILKKFNLCFKCFDKHKRGECKVSNCFICNRPHNALVCFQG